MKSPLNYLGGKSRLAKTVVSQIPEHTCYCEPFCGAAWVFFAKEPSRAEILNDIDGELTTFWRVAQNHLEEFLRFFRFAVVSRTIFDLEQQKRPELLTDIQRAVRYFYLQKLSFGGKTHKRSFGSSATGPLNLNLSTIESTLIEVHWRLSRVTIENLDACDYIERYDRPTTFFYLDPPYHETAGYRAPFTEADYKRLKTTLLNLKGRFIMSINDTAAVRRLFKGLPYRKVSTTYSAANGRAAAHKRSCKRSELLLHNL